MSSFDPFGVYSRRPYYNRKAQINRKKPVFHGGSVSPADLPYLEKKIKALGYKIDYGSTPSPPPSPPDLEISEVIHSNITIILNSSSKKGYITQSQIRDGVLQMQLFDLPAPPSSFDVIENIDWVGLQFPGVSSSSSTTQTEALYLRCPHFTATLAPSQIIGSSPAKYKYPSDIGTEYISATQVMFCQNEDDISSENLPQNLNFNKTTSPENNPYTISTKIYSGLEYYEIFKTGTGIETLDPLLEIDGSAIPIGQTFYPSQINLVGVMSIEVKYRL